MKTFIKQHGGKAYLAEWLLSHAPAHTKYAEPFGGGAALLLRKAPAREEYYYDLNPGLVNLWKVLQVRTCELVEGLKGLVYTDYVFEISKKYCQKYESVPADRDLGWAAAFYTRSRMSRGGLGESFAWSDRLRGGQPGDVNAWQNAIADLPRIAKRIQDVTFQCRDFTESLSRVDSETFVYCDPPYVHSTRTSTKSYGPYEMSASQHLELLNLLKKSPAKVMLSGYDNDLYNSILCGWKTATKSIVNHAAQNKTKAVKLEKIWMNY